MINTPKRQALLECLLGRLLLKNHDLKVTSYDQPEVAADRLALFRLDNLTTVNHSDLEAFMAEHEAEDFSFGNFAEGSGDPKDWTEATRFYTLLLGAKAIEQSLGENEVTETKQCDFGGSAPFATAARFMPTKPRSTRSAAATASRADASASLSSRNGSAKSPSSITTEAGKRALKPPQRKPSSPPCLPSTKPNPLAPERGGFLSSSFP